MTGDHGPEPETVERGPAVRSNPRVSVVIPAYRPDDIDTVLDSIRAQTYESFEIIVVDDGSPEPVRPVKTEDIILIRQPNQGPGGARNRGVAEAKGEWIAFLDSDDRWLPTKLQRQVAYHAAHTSCALTTTDVYIVTETGRTLLTLRERYGLEPGQVPFEKLFSENCIVCSSAMVRTDAYRRTPGMHPTRRAAEDYGLWLRLGLEGSVGYLGEALCEHSDHDGSLTAAGLRAGTWHLAELEVYEEFLREHPELRGAPYVGSTLARAEFDLGYQYLASGAWRDARLAFGRAIRHYPLRLRNWVAWTRAVLHLGPRSRT